MTAMGKTVEAEYLADERVLRLSEPLVGVRDHERVRVTIDGDAIRQSGDWPELTQEAGRDLARAVREAFGRNDIAV